jgi:signal transduction histidine kinase
VRGVVEAHGGSVWIESAGVPGEGTIVHILLPWMPVTSDARL